MRECGVSEEPHPDVIQDCTEDSTLGCVEMLGVRESILFLGWSAPYIRTRFSPAPSAKHVFSINATGDIR
jgi:hypothetical protein